MTLPPKTHERKEDKGETRPIMYRMSDLKDHVASALHVCNSKHKSTYLDGIRQDHNLTK